MNGNPLIHSADGYFQVSTAAICYDQEFVIHLAFVSVGLESDSRALLAMNRISIVEPSRLRTDLNSINTTMIAIHLY